MTHPRNLERGLRARRGRQHPRNALRESETGRHRIREEPGPGTPIPEHLYHHLRNPRHLRPVQRTDCGQRTRQRMRGSHKALTRHGQRLDFLPSDRCGETFLEPNAPGSASGIFQDRPRIEGIPEVAGTRILARVRIPRERRLQFRQRRRHPAMNGIPESDI